MSTAQTNGTPDHVAQHRRRSVLVVEDNGTTRGRMAQVLTAHGYQVEEASDGREALQKAAGSDVDAILLDLLMPNVDGWQFRETQLRHPQLAHIPTVVVTVRPLREPDRYVLRVNDVVLKPFTEEQLLEAVARALSGATGAAPPERIRSERSPEDLFWSKRGEVACARHAPSNDSDRWRAERWEPIPATAGEHGIAYQCKHCFEREGPIRQRRSPSRDTE
jgi:CheY-like chemotaxis protein